jgi:hypothetical protein
LLFKVTPNKRNTVAPAELLLINAAASFDSDSAGSDKSERGFHTSSTEKSRNFGVAPAAKQIAAASTAGVQEYNPSAVEID